MGQRNSTALTYNQTVGSLGNFEAVIAVTPFLLVPNDGSQVIIMWACSAQGAAGCTSTIYRVRRGATTAGTLLNPNAQADTTCTTTATYRSGLVLDVPGNVGPIQYCLTLQYNAGAAGGTNDSTIFALCL